MIKVWHSMSDVWCKTSNFRCYFPETMFNVRCSLFNVQCLIFDVLFHNCQLVMITVWCSIFDIRHLTFNVQCSMLDVQCSFPQKTFDDDHRSVSSSFYYNQHQHQHHANNAIDILQKLIRACLKLEIHKTENPGGGFGMLFPKTLSKGPMML